MILKPLLSDKVKSSDKITLVEGGEIINEGGKNAEILNTFFSNSIKVLKIPAYQDADPLIIYISTNNISHPILRAIMKFRNHPSIIAIKDFNKSSRLDFCSVSVENVVTDIKKLSARKAKQSTDLPVKIFKEKLDIFGSYIRDFFSYCVDKGDFQSILKLANITPVFTPKAPKITIDQ